MADVVGLDPILKHVGEFGKDQGISFTLIFIITIFNGACHMAYVFTTMGTENRCFIPGCDKNLASFEADHVNFTIPLDISGKLKKCERFLWRNNTNDSLSCSAGQFEGIKTSLCEEFIFKDEEISIAKEYHLFCEEGMWELILVGTVNTLGMMLGIWISGHLSDRYGRKAVLISGMSLGGLVGVSKTFTPSFEAFCFLEFLEAFIQSGSHDCLFILAMELVSPDHRFRSSYAFFSFCSFGQMVLAAVAWTMKDWRLLIYILYIPCTFFVFLHPFIMESIRWQLSKGHIERAKYKLNKMAKSKGKTIPPSYFFTIQRKTVENKEKCRIITLTKLMKSRILLLRLIISIFLWIICALLFYGLSLSSMNLAGNDYLNFLLVSFIEIPAYFMMFLIAEKVKRKTLLIFSYFFSSASCLALLFFGTEGSGFLSLILHCSGKFGVSIAFSVVYIITSEMFPTPLRHSTMGLCSMIGRLGSMISPQISLMSTLWLPLPNVIFASTAGLGGLLSFFLPETIGVTLPDTLEEAEVIGKTNISDNETNDFGNS